AVLIGINEYPPSSKCSPLQGCVNNVEGKVKFLVNDLGVPQDHIQCLLSTSPKELCITRITVTSPTCKNIINTLLSLSTRHEIHHGDNIIIYFTGHGSWYDPSDLYGAGNILAEESIKALCPIDHTPPSRTKICIPNISNREINIILTEISHTKGHNITLILDSCYSTGNTKAQRFTEVSFCI
ncbi:hypothetical protein ARMGADRAFT_943286, partial [Armillaria gallica]